METGQSREQHGIKSIFLSKKRLEYYLKVVDINGLQVLRITCVPEVNERDDDF